MTKLQNGSKIVYLLFTLIILMVLLHEIIITMFVALFRRRKVGL